MDNFLQILVKKWLTNRARSDILYITVKQKEKMMQGTIRTFQGLAMLVAAGSVNDTLSTDQFLMISMALAIPGALIGFSGVRALNRAEQENF